MQTVEESVCCRELHNVVRMCSDQGVPCVTKHPLFELYCLNTDILDLEYLKLRYFCPLDAGDRGPQEYVYCNSSRSHDVSKMIFSLDTASPSEINIP